MSDLRCNAQGRCPCDCHELNQAETLKAAGIDPTGLTVTEGRLAAALLPIGRIRPTEELMAAVWGGAVVDNAVRTYVDRLRKKGVTVKNKPWVGYWLE